MVEPTPPTFFLYVGIITSKSAAEGMGDALTFGFHGYAVWDGKQSFTVNSGLKANNPPSKDVMLTAPDVGTPALVTIIPQNDGTKKMYFTPLVWSTPHKDCDTPPP